MTAEAVVLDEITRPDSLDEIIREVSMTDIAQGDFDVALYVSRCWQLACSSSSRVHANE